MKERAASHEPTAAIINREIALGVHKDYQGQLPKVTSLKRAIQRSRRRHLPPLPESAGDLILEGPWTRSAAGEEWLVLSPTPGDDEPMLIIATPGNLRYLAAANTWYADGTFSVAPKLFAQV